MNEINWMQQGWECPKCGAVMAPHVDCCVNCRGNKGGNITVVTSGMLDAPYILTTDPPEAKYTSAKETPDEQWDRYYLNI